MDWYQQMLQFLTFFSEPLGNLYYSQQTPILGALLLGVLGALAPCQISSNLGAISYTTNRMTQGEKWNRELISFFAGKTLVYFLLAALVLMIGKGLEEWTIPIFQVTRKIMGPLFLITGLYFIGWIKINGIFTERLLKYRGITDKFTGNKRAFLLGILLSLAFCPTMFLLFFGLLLPLVLSTPGYGLALPFLFSLGTFLPVLLFLGVAFGIGVDRNFIKRSKKVGRIVQVVSGIVLIFIGVNDIILYWTL
jgi:cytochrome c-type biogenesis protein